MNINELYEQTPESLRGNIAVSASKVTIKWDDKLTEEYDITGFEDVKAEDSEKTASVQTLARSADYKRDGDGKVTMEVAANDN